MSEETKTTEQSLEQFRKSILLDGVVDATEASEIETRIYADGKIDKEEADFLFAVNDGVSGKANATQWQDIFVKGVSDYVLADDTTPGVVDEEEAKYLIDQIGLDGQVDDVEKALLANIKANATSMHPSLVTFMTNVGV